jgi:alpha-L-rhamnosidase
LTWATTRYDSIQGTIATSWHREGNNIKLEVVIPANTTATVSIPAEEISDLTESGKSLKNADGVKLLRQENGKAILEIGSGTYEFASEIMK